MNVIEKYIDRKIRRLAYLSSCKHSKKEDIIEKNYQKYQESVAKKKVLAKNNFK